MARRKRDQIKLDVVARKFKERQALIVRGAAEIAAEHFKDSFDDGGFTDKALSKWPKRKRDKDRGRATLVKTGNLRDSIRVTKASRRFAIVEASAPYAAVHNNGGRVVVRVTAKSKKFFWAMFFKTGNQMYKGMALTKKKKFIYKMPKRQFMGRSFKMNIKIEALIIAQIKQLFKKFA